MAIKALMLKKRLSEKTASLESLRAKEAEFKTREAELEKAIEEAETEEEKDAVEAEVESFDKEQKENAEGIRTLSAEIESIEAEIDAEETRQAETIKEMVKPETVTKETRAMKFNEMDIRAKEDFFNREDVKQFVNVIRTAGKEKRAVSGGDVLIPTVILDIIRQDIEDYSKLYKHVRTRFVAGNATQPVLGAVPEAVWTEMCGKLNEVTIGFTAAEVSGYKVAGYVAVCNALLDDSDVALGSEIIRVLGQSVGYALDKAILYGTGTKMPLGIVARLAQTAAPSDYSPKERAWEDLHESNIVSIAASKSDTALFKAIVEATGKAKNGAGELFWACNATTRTALLANSIGVNSSAAIMAGMNGSMPVVGGAIEVLDFIPDNVIIGGYGERYLLAEREGTKIDWSRECQFIEDNTVYGVKARYDGKPVIAESFVAIGINGATPDATMTFASDSAN